MLSGASILTESSSKSIFIFTQTLCMRTAKVLAGLCMYAGSPGHSLFASTAMSWLYHTCWAADLLLKQPMVFPIHLSRADYHAFVLNKPLTRTRLLTMVKHHNVSRYNRLLEKPLSRYCLSQWSYITMHHETMAIKEAPYYDTVTLNGLTSQCISTN